MTHRLKDWAVIDIETTGADQNYDDIIDVGFLLFSGTKLVKKYSTLVRTDKELSSFIQKLTGITKKMLAHAPIYKEIEGEIQDLYGMKLIAHNSDFEAGFLKKSFDKIDDGNEREEFVDSLYFLGVLFPEYSTLKLEHFIKEWEIRESEVHRGLEDSIDLLKVILVAAGLTQKDKAFYQFLKLLLLEKKLDDFYLMQFLHLSHDELLEIATAIDFNLEDKITVAQKKLWPIRFHEKFPEEKRIQNFPLIFNGENIKSIFNAEEKIRTIFPLYKARNSQIEMAMRVGQSFKNNVHALIQAPTGTGKTFAYLIPSVLFSLEEKKQVLISTGTKTLQHQAYLKDVPKVMEFLGINSDKMKMKMLVGSSNHLCESLFRQGVAENSLLSLAETFEEKYIHLFFEVLFFHNSRNKSDEKILRDDLPYVLKMKVDGFFEKDKALAVDYRSCTGNMCPFKNNCTYMLGLKEARDADIIIGNHALMFTWPKAMPRPTHIVVDEAHKIEEEATSSFSVQIEELQLKNFIVQLAQQQGLGSLFYLLSMHEMVEGESTPVIKKLREEVLRAHQMLNDHIFPMSELSSVYFKKSSKYTEIYWNELPMISKSSHTDPLALKILSHVESMAFIFSELEKVLNPFADRFDVKSLKNENEILAYTRFETFYSSVLDYKNAFSKLLLEDKNDCRSFKFLENEGFVFALAPIDVGQIVKDQLLALSSSVVFTSATLANEKGDTGGKGIEWSTGYSYLESERRFKSGFYLPSAYDYKNKTKVYLCDDAPSLYETKFVSEIIKKIKPLIYNLNGRSLLLFSAKSRFEEAREYLLKEFEGKIPLFIQGMGQSVVEDYKKSASGILLGMESFGEGIDIPGEHLQFIFIDKIPDLRMDLVINERRQFFESHIGNEFTDYYLAHRTRSLHQKLGRLLRTEEDFGGVMIVDNRIKKWRGNTMEKLVRLMEPYKIYRGTMDEAVKGIEEFILYPTDHSKT